MVVITKKGWVLETTNRFICGRRELVTWAQLETLGITACYPYAANVSLTREAIGAGLPTRVIRKGQEATQ